MKQPSIPLVVAYKVVQVDSRGRMWSANISGNTLRDGKAGDGDLCIRYKLREIIRANKDSFGLFLCPTLAEGEKALNFYIGYSKNKCYLLRGYASKTYPAPNLSPDAFVSVCADMFIPIGIVNSR